MITPELLPAVGRLQRAAGPNADSALPWIFRYGNIGGSALKATLGIAVRTYCGVWQWPTKLSGPDRSQFI